MKVINKTNGKEITLPKKAFDNFAPSTKANFEIINANDEEPTKNEQVVTNEQAINIVSSKKEIIKKEVPKE